MKYIVDRIEGEYAVCEADDQSIVDFLLNELPANTKEGDHLVLENGVYKLIPADQERKDHIKNLMDDLWKI